MTVPNRDPRLAGRPAPLAGRRVLDVGTALAGPVCATLLGEFGADVIKVERPGTGDTLRTLGPTIEGTPLWWMIEGRNKRSITLDISRPQGQALARELIAVSDVLVENFRPGTMARWGLGYEEIHREYPRLVYVSVSGFGQTGPYRDRGAYDRTAQSLAGLVYLTGHPDGPPVKPGIGVTDYSTAIVAALGAMFALYERDAGGSGEGQLVDAALAESMLRMYHYYIPLFERTGFVPERTGNATEAMAPAERFRARDGQWVMVAVGSDRIFGKLAAAIGRPELAQDERFATNARRCANADEVHAIVRAWVTERDGADVARILEAADVPCAPLYTAQQVYEDPHFRAREAVATVEDAGLGQVAMQGVIPKLSGTPGTVRHTGPSLGASSQDVFCSLLGHSADELRRWRAEGII